MIYPVAGIVKAEIVEYYLTTSHLFLPHLRGRPLTLIRWPDGVEGKKIYSKKKPAWTPDWVSSQVLKSGAKKKEYVISDNKATMVWLANRLTRRAYGSMIPPHIKR